MKTIKKFYVFLLLGTLIFSLLFTACNKEKTPTKQGNVYTLEKAYDKELLTEENLEEMANSQKISGNQATEILGVDLEREIKQITAKRWSETDEMRPNLTADDMTFLSIWGHYGECYVVMVYPKDLMWTAEDMDVSLTVGNTTFRFSHTVYLEMLVVYEKIPTK